MKEKGTKGDVKK